VTLIVQTVAEI